MSSKDGTPTAEEIKVKETVDALEERDEESKKVDEKLKNDLAAYKVENDGVQYFRYKQPDVELPPDAHQISIHEDKREEPKAIPEGAKCEGESTMCSKGRHRCPNCTQIYCKYHAKPNTGGWHGGHTCKGTVACSSTFHFNCDKQENKICPGCGLSYCNYHFKGGTNFVTPGGHLCSGGCSTSLIFTPNCKGVIKVCPECKLNYCDYHHKTSSTMFTDLSAGHVCREVTGGAMLFGDSFGDFFSLAGQVVVTIASGGTCPIAAVTLLFRSMKIAALAMIDKYGLQDMKPFAMTVVNWVSKQTGIGEGELTDKNRAGRSIMFTDNMVSDDNIALFCGMTKATGLAIDAITKMSPNAIPSWLITAVKTAKKIGDKDNIKIYQRLVINAIKSSFMISEILGLVYHLEAAWAGNLAEIILAVKGAANVIDDFNILFGFTTEDEVKKKNLAQGQSIELTSAEVHRSLEFKHSKAHAERSVAPMSDTDHHIIQYARKNNHGQGNPFIESLMAFDSQIELLKNRKREVGQAHDEEVRRLTDRIRELEASNSYVPAPGPHCLSIPEKFLDSETEEEDEFCVDSQEDEEYWT
eukprot:CAMPEP_0194159668 /NCGR_PEP_ID=MMETSP0152-20130528/77965_1 /TAXON_ID=1049557 /ORGANISM="Thalassiothrix antarctica, Strain L6-D1" /LENGTH=582 /DNA_ID=CAMNT_0038869277 /DNA_START=132 /DNA_END=1880 /DNA_ORIENTATION=-